MWQSHLKGYKAFLQLELSLSENSVQAYLADIQKLAQYFLLQDKREKRLEEIKLHDLQDFLAYLNELGLEATSQARIISGLKSFFKFLLMEDILQDNPTELLSAPKTGRKLPDVLSIEEVELFLSSIDVSSAGGRFVSARTDSVYVI